LRKQAGYGPVTDRSRKLRLRRSVRARACAVSGNARPILPPGASFSGARRFDVGNYNYLGSTAVEPGLKLVSALTTKAIEKHVLALGDQLTDGLKRIGLPILASRTDQHRSNIVAIGEAIGLQHGMTDSPTIQSLYNALIDNGVRLTIRRGVLRLSLHLYNNADDIERVIEIARSWRST
jgi:cysteine desulfurase/selenocysteine lyase